MKGFLGILNNEVFISAVYAWVIAQSIKIIIALIKTKKFQFDRIAGSGGMPSSHSASVMAASFTVGETMGYHHPLFGICIVFSMIIMYDAAGVRRAAGHQAVAINKIIKALGSHKFKFELKELLGHTYIEVFVGAILGIIIALLNT